MPTLRHHRHARAAAPWLAVLVLMLAVSRALPAATVEVSTNEGLQQALSAATPGTTILVAPGTYSGEIYIIGVLGTAAAPIIVEATDPSNQPVFSGNGEGIHLGACSYITLRNMTFTAQSDQAINCDDNNDYDGPGHTYLTFDHLTIHDIATTSNPSGDISNGIKLSGIDYFTVSNCTITNWGGPVGDGIDCVGCHNSVVTGCTLSATDEGTSGGLQFKGGSADIDINHCTFLHAGQRGLQMGGSTGLQFFRPSSSVGYEASNITAEYNVFIGCDAAVAFTGLSGGSFTYNTVYCPVTWLNRILEEDTSAGMAETEDVTVADNIFAFTSSLQTAVNIGPDTLPQTFTYTGNWWYCIGVPSDSTPSLPVTESGGTYGADPQFVDAANGDLQLEPGSGASSVGAYAQGSATAGTTAGTTAAGTGITATGSGTGGTTTSSSGTGGTAATGSSGTGGTSGTITGFGTTGPGGGSSGGGGCGLGAGASLLIGAMLLRRRRRGRARP